MKLFHPLESTFKKCLVIASVAASALILTQVKGVENSWAGAGKRERSEYNQSIDRENRSA
ncbi:hypothetical protein [Aeromonas enteropelogenes]|uniref:hypothetical protein n=1 Tax=Aeromonas enteropelogenes TaxID=29489 RepID=UPI003B9E4463